MREQTWPETDVQFCPLCLQEAAYHRVNWMPLAVAVCLRHQCLLAHGCPNCAEDIRVRDILDVQCPNCGLALTEAPVVSIAADEFGLFSQAVLQAWLGLLPPPCADALAALPGYPPAVLYRVLEGLRCAVMRVQHGWDYLYAAPSGVGVPLFPCASKGDITPAKAYILYATAFRALVDWPRGFHEFLEAYRRRDWRLVTGCIQEDYGYLYISCLEKLWRHPAYRFVQEAFDQYLLDNYPITPTLARLRRAQDDPAFSMTG